MFDDLDLTKITGEHTREHVARLLNLIETLGADLRAAQAEIQRLCGGRSGTRTARAELHNFRSVSVHQEDFVIGGYVEDNSHWTLLRLS